MIEILDAILSELRAGTNAFTVPVLTATNSSIEPGGNPPPRSGDFYLSIDESGVSTEGIQSQYEINELHSVEVFLSLRVSGNPRDRYDVLYRREAKGLRNLERQVLRAIHGKQAVRVAANSLLVSRSIGGANYLTPLYYERRGKTEIHGADWSNEDGSNINGWLVRRLPFVGMRRVQYLNSIT